MPPNAPHGLDTPLPPPDGISISWAGLGNLVPILRSEPLSKPTTEKMIKPDPVSADASDDETPSNPGADSLENSHELTWGEIVREAIHIT